MASQASRWIYDKQSYAKYALANWNPSYSGESLNDIMKHFTSTQLIERETGTRLVDNMFRNYGLVLLPYSDSLGIQGGDSFGVFTNVIDEEAPFTTSINGIYGQKALRGIIAYVFNACGLKVSDEINPDIAPIRRTYKDWYIDTVIRNMLLPENVEYDCNIYIKAIGGLLVSYVDKYIIQSIIDAMNDVGMFHKIIHTQIPSETGTYIFDLPHVSTSDSVNSIDFLLTSDYIRALQANPTFADSDSSYCIGQIKNEISTQMRSAFFAIESSGESIEDYTFTTYSSVVSIQRVGQRTIFTYRGYVDFIKEPNGTCEILNVGVESGEEYAEYRTTNHTPPIKSYHIDCYIREEITPLQDPEYYLNGSYVETSANYFRSYVGRKINDASSAFGTYSSNANTSFEYPDGITIETDATIPEENNYNIDDLYSDWVADGVSLQVFSNNSRDFDYYTYIPLALFESDQAIVQSGIIDSDAQLAQLGVNLREITDYTPIDPDDEGGGRIPIDPDPRPTPTPPDVTPTRTSASMFRVWNIDNTNLDTLATELWSDSMVQILKDRFNSPTDAIIGLFTLIGVSPVGTLGTIKLGNAETQAQAQRITERYYTLDCGTVSVSEYYGNVEDYSPYSSAIIYLPFCGFKEIDINEIMGGRVNVKYIIDAWSGACLAKIFVTRDGVLQELYAFEGNCAVQMPVTDRDFTNAFNALLGGIGATVAGGLMTGAPGVVAGLATTVVGVDKGLKHTILRSGALGANHGAMGNQKPYILIKRPLAYNADNYPYYYGQPSNWTCTLGNAHGYTRIKDIHLDQIPCTDEEKVEIENMLKQGVIF